MNPEKFNRHVKMSVHEITKSKKDPTLMPVKLTIIDFGVSGNGTQMSKEVALEGGKTLKGKPIVARYYETSDYHDQDDNFGSHEMIKKRNRYGEVVDAQNTIPIGVFTSEGYLETVEINGEYKEVMVAEGNLWYYKFQDACELLYEWHQRGVNINTSCEYLYFNYSKIDGVEHHLSPIIFNAHAILASETRGEQEEVKPSYESSKVLSINELNEFAKLVTQAYNEDIKKAKNQDKEVEKLAENKKDTQEDLDKAQTQTHEDDKVDETVNENPNPENKADEKATNEGVEDEKTEVKDEDEEEVAKKEDEAKAEKTEEVPAKEEPDALELANQKNAELQAELDGVYEKFNKATETMVSMQERIKHLEAIEVQFNEYVAQEKIKAQFNAFKPKFDAVGATEKFESEEVQNLIELSIHETEDGRKAVMQLQSLIIESINIANHSQEEQKDSPNLGLHSYHRKDYNKELDNGDLDDFDSRFLAKNQ